LSDQTGSHRRQAAENKPDDVLIPSGSPQSFNIHADAHRFNTSSRPKAQDIHKTINELAAIVAVSCRESLPNPEFDNLPPRVRDRIEKRVRVCMAGVIAQRHHSPRNIRSWHGQPDVHAAVNLLNRLTASTSETEAWLKLLHIQPRA
jgi:hypothetical protein